MKGGSDFAFDRRIAVIFAVMLLGFIVLALRLYSEQISSGEDSRETIVRQSIRRIRIPAQRGRIYSSDMKLLAGNTADLNLVFYPHEMRRVGRRRTVRHILDAAALASAMIGRPNPIDSGSVNAHLNRQPGLPLMVFEKLTPEETARAVEFVGLTGGAALETSWERFYPQGMEAAHLVGYVRPDDSQKAGDRGEFFYYIPDQVGRSGVERAFDRMDGALDGEAVRLRGLRGEPGYSLVRVDNLGFVRNVLIEEIEPKQGNHAVLTLDSRAQTIAEGLFGRHPGAFVLLDADNGDVLASVSSPGYDLQRFLPRLSPEYYSQLRDDPAIPLYNRALVGTYTPGSILKPLIALAFLEHGVDPSREIICDGTTKVGNTDIKCASFRYGGHGRVDMVRALEKSCNDYFIEIAIELGLEPLRPILSKAGIGRRPQIELPAASGVAPSVEYKQRTDKARWTAHDTGMLSIGQGTVTVSPLQAAAYCAALANGGRVYRPHLLKELVDQYGTVLYRPEPVVESELGVTPAHLDIVRRGMFEVVNSPTGSGRRAKVAGLEIYGKTGTAEVGPRDRRKKNVWFIAFVKHNDRTYACALMYEDAGSGGGDCAPMVAEFFRRYTQ